MTEVENNITNNQINTTVNGTQVENNVTGNQDNTTVNGPQLNNSVLFIQTTSLPQLDSDLAMAITALSRTKRIKSNNNLDFRLYNIHDKIPHNNVNIYKLIIQTYAAYHGKIEMIYNELEEQDEGIKDTILASINSTYIDTLGEFLKDYPANTPRIDIIKRHADEILQKTESKLTDEVLACKNLSFTQETLKISIPKIVVHAFIECEILEKP